MHLLFPNSSIVDMWAESKGATRSSPAVALGSGYLGRFAEIGLPFDRQGHSCRNCLGPKQ